MMRQNLGWAIGYNSIAVPIAAGVFEPSLGLELRPEIAALSMPAAGHRQAHGRTDRPARRRRRRCVRDP